MGIRMQTPRLREGAAPVLHSWVKQKPERPAPKQRCSPTKKKKGACGPNKIDEPEDASASCSDPGLDTNMATLQPDLATSPSPTALPSQTTSSLSTTKVSVGTQTTVTTSTQTTQTQTSQTVEVVTTPTRATTDHEYTFVKDSSQTLESYKDYVLKIESKLQGVEEKHKQLKKSVSDLRAQAAIRACMPLQFSKYPTTRIIIDCTEIFIEAPSAMLAQSQTWSNYKHHNTWKALVVDWQSIRQSYHQRFWPFR
ncbi:hypothetical protein Bbelb_074630 [Branchiostoma belcheri]|nr:hypothetical protein Bbelb_074630 [Branchiostoma belcheri]